MATAAYRDPGEREENMSDVLFHLKKNGTKLNVIILLSVLAILAAAIPALMPKEHGYSINSKTEFASQEESVSFQMIGTHHAISVNSDGPCKNFSIIIENRAVSCRPDQKLKTSILPGGAVLVECQCEP